MPQQLRQNGWIGCGDENHMIRAGVILPVERRSSTWKQQEHSGRFRLLVKVAADRLRIMRQRF
jgi:hypothetical protein